MSEGTDTIDMKKSIEDCEAGMQKETGFQESGPILKRSKPQKSDSAPKGKDDKEAVENEDRFDDLPDNLVHHILSFMETKDAIQTCVLSKRWIDIWTAIPCLNFNSRSFSRLADFRKFIMWVLSRRESTLVKDLIYCRAGVDYATDQVLFNKVIDYATSHGVENIRVNLRAKVAGSPPIDIPLSLLNCQSLKSLELKHCHPTKVVTSTGYPVKKLHLEHFTMDPATDAIPNSISSLALLFAFTTLTTLNLSSLTLCCDGIESLNPFGNCFNLKNLHLKEICFKSNSAPEDFVISAPQLSNLTLSCNRFKCKIAVVAPQLINFGYLYASPCAFFEFSIPSKDMFTIDIREPNNQLEEPHQRLGEKTAHGLVNMYRACHDADAELVFCTAVVSCGTAVMPKKEFPSCINWKSLNVRVGSTYKIFTSNLDNITAYFRHSSEDEDFEIMSV